MKAVGVFVFGGPEVLRVVDVPEPHAGPGEVRIRVHAAAVSPSDTLMRAGHVPLPGVKPPYIPGQDAAGVVDEIGQGTVTGLRVGDRVMAAVMPIGPRGGAYAEHVVLPASWVTGAPAGASHAEAATLPMNGLTARLALDLLALSAGQTVAVTGAAGAFGGYLVQLAKADGLRVVADASPADEELVRALGADIVVAGATMSPRGSATSCPRGWTGWPTARSSGRPWWPRSVTAGASPRSAVPDPSACPNAASPITTLRSRLFRGMGQARSVAASGGDRRGDPAGSRHVSARRGAEAHRLLEAGGTRGRLVLEF